MPAERGDPPFEPFVISIKIESVEDAAKLYAIYNYSPCASAIGLCAFSECMRQRIASKVPDVADLARPYWQRIERDGRC